MPAAPRANTSKPPYLGFGLGLRHQHYTDILEGSPPVDWFEAISENYFAPGGRPIQTLMKIRDRYPVVLHGVSLSIATTAPLDTDYLGRLKSLAAKVEPQWVSDHLCWTGVGGRNAHDLLPLPYTEETLRHVVPKVARVQEVLGRRIALENVSSYLTYAASTMSEWEFLTAVAERGDCGILLDINNIYVSAVNHGFDPAAYVDAVPVDRVWQFHLAGHSDHGAYLLDTHDHPVRDEVWDLYRRAVARFGRIPALIEWDGNIPEWDRLEAECLRAKQAESESLRAADAPARVSP